MFFFKSLLKRTPESLSRDLLSQEICKRNLYHNVDPGVVPSGSFEMEGNLKYVNEGVCLLEAVLRISMRSFLIRKGVGSCERLHMFKESYSNPSLCKFSRQAKLPPHQPTPPSFQDKAMEG